MSEQKTKEEGSFKIKKSPKKLSQEKPSLVKAKTKEEVEEAADKLGKLLFFPTLDPDKDKLH